VAVVELPLGSHTLRFCVDGEWKTSAELPTLHDAAGNLVNYLEIGEVRRRPVSALHACA
jgi:hypothetical protein